MMIELINNIGSIAAEHSTVDFWSGQWGQFIISNINGILGGAVGGVLAYGLYIRWQEEKREIYNKKSSFADSLLTLQNALILQMLSLRGVKNICNDILSFKIGDKSLFELFNKKEKIEINEHTPLGNLLFPIVTQGLYNILNIPYEILSIKDVNLTDGKISHHELTIYFMELSRCNKKYLDIISIVENNNKMNEIHTSGFVLSINDPIKENIIKSSMLFGRVKLAQDVLLRLDKQINFSFFLFEKAASYIEKIGLFEPLKLERDINGKVVFDEISN